MSGGFPTSEPDFRKNPKSRGATPTTTTGVPLRRTVFPTIDGSAPNSRFQVP
jgi:hypothetical protein